MRMNTSIRQPCLFINREAPGIGDLGMITRGVELTRLKYPNAWIGIRCRYPDLIWEHPAYDVVWSLDNQFYTRDPKEVLTTRDVERYKRGEILSRSEQAVHVTLEVLRDFDTPKHKAFCDQIGDALLSDGFDPIEWDGRAQTLWVSRELKRRSLALVGKESDGRIPIGIFWRSAWEFKNWHGFPELIQILANDSRFAVFCFDAKEPVGIDGVIDVVDYPLDQVAAIVSSLKLVIGNDSGGIHIAGGVGVPVLGLFGATDAEKLIGCYDATWFDNTCPHHPCWFKRKCFSQPCLREISPQTVHSEIAKKFRKRDFTDIALPLRKPVSQQERWLLARFVGLGDVLMTWFILEYLRMEYPEIHISYLTSPEAATLFYGQDDLVDEVIPMPFKHHALPGHVELPIDLTGWDKVFNLINLVDSGKIVYRRPRVANFAALMDLDLPTKLPVRKLKISEQERQWFYRIVGDDAQKVFAFQLDSNGLPRRWFPGHFQELAWMLYKAYGDQAKILCLGSKVEPKLKLPPTGINLSGKTNIREFVTSLVLADGIVCTDSSGLHIGARADHAQVFGLFGSTGITDPGEWAHTNYYDNIVHIQSDRKCAPCWDWQLDTCRAKIRYPVCLWKIKPKQVFEIIQQKIGGETNGEI